MKKLLSIFLAVLMALSCALYVANAESETNRVVYCNSPYIYAEDVFIGNSQIWEFDLCLMNENSAFCIWADTVSTIYTIAYDYVGVYVNNQNSAYGESDYVSIKWSSDSVGLNTLTWKRIKVELNIDGKDNIYINGLLVWSGKTTANNYWGDEETSGIIISSGFGIEKNSEVMIDNLLIMGTDTYGPYSFEQDLGFFDLCYYETEYTIDLVFVCKHNTKTIAEKVEATCTETGYSGNTVCVDCGAVIAYGNVIPAQGHDVRGWIVETEPTSFKSGIATGLCWNCAMPIDRELPMTTEDFGLREDNKSRLITGIPAGVTIDLFILHYDNMGMRVTVTDKLGTTPTYVGTGCITTWEGYEFTVCVKGDMNGDGVINSKDLIRFKKYLTVVVSFDDAETAAADIDESGKVNARDSLALRKILKNGI